MNSLIPNSYGLNNITNVSSYKETNWYSLVSLFYPILIEIYQRYSPTTRTLHYTTLSTNEIWRIPKK